MTIEELAEKLSIELTDDSRADIDAYLATEVTGLKANNAKLKTEKRDIAKKLDALEKLDVEAVAEAIGQEIDDFDLDELPDLIEALKTAKDPDPKDPPKDDPRIADLERKLERAKKRGEDEMTEKDLQIGALKKAIGSNSVSADAAAAISSAEGSVKGLMPHVKGRIKTEVDDDGNVETTVLAANGEPMEDNKGNPATLKDLVEELRRDEDLGGLFKANPGGPGTKPPRNNPGGKKWSEMNLDERTKLKQSFADYWPWPILFDILFAR